jgi:putative oxygen-independent coproporphyrinogen III oxidase
MFDLLLSNIRSIVKLSPFAEITIEVNPGSIDNQKIASYKQAGINRISLGIQSFNDKHLQLLGRIHNSHQAIEAINLAKCYFQQVNLDLMYGLPTQTLNELLHDIDIALGFAPNHLSYYNLTIEPNTEFYNNPPPNIANNDLCYKMQTIITNKLANVGLNRYEISAYAQQQNQCKHNLNYWQFGDYLGIGAGAHSKISFPDRIVRQVRQKHPQTYINQVHNGNHLIENKDVLVTDLPFEFMLNTLRLVDGFTLNLFQERSGLTVDYILPKLNTACKEGFLNIRGSQITPTTKGLDFANELLMLFLPD